MALTSTHYHVLSIIIMLIGVFGVLSKKDLVGILMSVMLITTASIINFIAGNTFGFLPAMHGHLWYICIAAVGIAESIIGISIAVILFKNEKIYLLDVLRGMKG